MIMSCQVYQYFKAIQYFANAIVPAPLEVSMVFSIQALETSYFTALRGEGYCFAA